MFGEFLELGRLQLRPHRHAAAGLRATTRSAPATSPNVAGSPFTDPDAFRIDGGWGADPNDPAGWNTGWGGNIVTKPTWDGNLRPGRSSHPPDSPGTSPLRPKRREHETGQTMAGVSVAAVGRLRRRHRRRSSTAPAPSNYLSGFGDTGDLSNRFTIDGWAMAD